MIVTSEFVGRRFQVEEPYLVGREHVRAFAAAVFATNPVHFDLAAARTLGYKDVVAPTTYPAVLQDRCLQLFLADPDAKFELKNIVHGDERFSYVRPIVAGDELTAQLEVTAVRAVRTNSMVQAATQIMDAAGELVVTAYATLVIGASEEK